MSASQLDTIQMSQISWAPGFWRQPWPLRSRESGSVSHRGKKKIVVFFSHHENRSEFQPTTWTQHYVSKNDFENERMVTTYTSSMKTAEQKCMETTVTNSGHNSKKPTLENRTGPRRRGRGLNPGLPSSLDFGGMDLKTTWIQVFPKTSQISKNNGANWVQFWKGNTKKRSWGQSIQQMVVVTSVSLLYQVE